MAPRYGFCTGSGPISINEINYYFDDGNNLGAYRGRRWAKRFGSGPGQWAKGNFSPAPNPISMYEFYNTGPYIDYFGANVDFVDLGGSVTVGTYNSLGLFWTFNHRFTVGPWQANQLYLGKGGSASELYFTSWDDPGTANYFAFQTPIEVRVKIDGIFDATATEGLVSFDQHVFFFPPTGGVVTGTHFVEIFIIDAPGP